MRTCFLLLNALSTHLLANPSGGTVVSGNVKITSAGEKMSLAQTSPTAIIEWADFSIGALESVVFKQPSSVSSALNRVTGSEMSQIQGKIQGNGIVYLINQNGILVGPEGIVQTGGFVASTLDVANAEYLAGKDLNFQGTSSARIINNGIIEASGGNIFLIAQNVRNQGSLEALQGSVGIAVASDVLVQETGEQKIFVRPSAAGFLTNKGIITAAGLAELRSAKSNVYSLAINHSGMIQATGMKTSNGKVILSALGGGIEMAGKVQAPNGDVQVVSDLVHLKNTSVIDTSGSSGGGTVLVGGGVSGNTPGMKNANFVAVDAGALISADATETGNGGTVSFWGDRRNDFYGTVMARGGNVLGNGGFVEVSSPGALNYQGQVDTTAKHGHTGTLSLDPADIVIDDFGGVGNSSPSFPQPAMTNNYEPVTTSSPNTNPASLDVADLMAALSTNNVTISTSAGSGGSGNVTINQNITWSEQTQLQILADQNIVFNGVTIENTYTGSTSAWTAMDFEANTGSTTITGDFNGLDLEVASLSSSDGNIYLLATGGNAEGNNGIYLSTSTITSTGTGSYPALITLNGTTGTGTQIDLNGIFVNNSSMITTNNGDVSLTGASNSTGEYCPGVYLASSSTIQALGTASVLMVGTGNSGGVGAYEGVGVIIDSSASVAANTGGIAIDGTAYATESYNQGVALNGGTLSTQGSLGIAITGVGGRGAFECTGVLLSENAVISTVNAPIAINGTSYGTLAYNNGISISASTVQTTGSGADIATVTLNGVGASGFHSAGVEFDMASQVNTTAGQVIMNGGVDSTSE